MSSLLVTVVGPTRRRDLSLPADTPIYELMPTLVRLVGEMGDGEHVEPDAWVLSGAAEEPLPPAATLSASQVLDGSVLYLAPAHPPEVAAPPPIPTRGMDVSPLERTASLLPRRRRVWARVGTALAAMGRPGPEGSPGESPQPWASPTPTPAALTAPPRPSPFRRARLAWRASGYLDQLEEAIAAPQLRWCITMAVVSPKGGVGKTTITALLGTLLSHIRRDRVVAVDTNPDYGSLGRVLAPSHTFFVDDLMHRVDDPSLTVTGLDTMLGRGPHGLRVVPAPTDPARMWRLDEPSYTKVIERLQELVNVVLLDCGTGLQEPAAGAAIKAAQQLILVADAEPAGASLVAEAGQLLARTGRPIMLVVNKVPRRGSRLNLEAFAESLPQASGMVVVPAEVEAAGHLSAGRFDWRDAPESWKRAARELAVALIADWPALNLTL
jgi:MinD-like ATPase involved in chromosome partitioning or flagellar assembly